MKFKLRNWWYRGTAPEMTIAELIVHEAEQSDHEGGQLEDIQRSLKSITKLLCVVVNELHPNVQIRIAEEIGADLVEE